MVTLSKELMSFSQDFQKANNFIFVTPYRWHKKESWLEDKRQLGHWKGINVIDADDIEIWFENAPAVALEFSELIGIAGIGAESVASYWKNWSEQSSPNISTNVIQKDREHAKTALLELIEKQKTLITIEADSREEAAAFCSSAILSHPLNKRSACITSEAGWRFCRCKP